MGKFDYLGGSGQPRGVRQERLPEEQHRSERRDHSNSSGKEWRIRQILKGAANLEVDVSLATEEAKNWGE